MRAGLLVVFVSACGLKSPVPLPDAGLDAGFDAGLDAGLADAGEPDAAVPHDAGPYARGDAGAWRFDDVTSPLSNITLVHGSGGTVIAATELNGLYSLDGGAWERLPSPMTFLTFGDVHVTDGGWLVAVGGNELHSCRGNCTVQTSWRTATRAPQYRLAAVCSRGNTVFAVGHDVLSGLSVGYRWELTLTNFWSNVDGVSAVGRALACAVGSDDALFVAGRRHVLELFADGGRTLVDLAGTDSFSQWWAIAAVGDEVVAAGDGKRIARRAAGGGWSLVSHGPAGDFSTWYTATVAEPGTLVLGGTRGQAGPAAVLTGSGLTLFPDPSEADLTDVWAQPGGPLYAVGYFVSDGGTVLYRVTR